ncbi:MAG: flippase-like domain-containing protein [Blastocatellia bacterium]|nr:flippase-like domain-containing protein [Blastocatellia bacterium]
MGKNDQSEKTDVGPIEKRRAFTVRSLLQVGIGLGALAFVLLKSDARGLLEAIKATQVSYLPLAFIASVLVTWLMALRWGMILKVRGHDIKTGRLFVYYLIGIFFSNFVPGGSVSGDVARLIYAGRDTGDRPFVLSTLVYERTVGLFVLLMTGLGAMLASRSSRPSGLLIYLIEAFLAAAFTALVLLMNKRVSSSLARLCRWAGVKTKKEDFFPQAERWGEAAARTLEAILVLRRYPGMLAATALVSIAIRVVWSLGCYVVALAMGLPLGPAVIFAFISLVDLIRLMPISIGGLGVREWALVVLFTNAGLAREQALMFSFLAFAPVMLSAVAGGILYISRAGLLRTERHVASAKEAGV